ILVEAAKLLRQSKPNLRFEVVAASPELAETMNLMGQDADVTIRVGNAADLMQRAFAGIVASGSATLEAAYFRMPFVLVYKVAWPTYLVGRMVVKLDHLGMPNVLAGK